MREILEVLFGTGRFMPHGACYLWEPGLVRLHLISDLLIGVAYYAIPPTLAILVIRARREAPASLPGPQSLPYDWMILAFGVFIVACGTTHFLEAWTIWTPAYWFTGWVKVATAFASVGTALLLPPLVPKALGLLREARESEASKARLVVAHRDLEAANRRLEELDELKSRLFANVSHELRTPLALVLGPTERLLESAELDVVVRRQLEIVQRNARTLAHHVEDLLDVSKLEAGKLRLRYVATDLGSLLREAASHFELVAEERQVAFSVETPERLLAEVDAERVRRVVLNLLSNAFKFTPVGGTVRARLTAETGPDDDAEPGARERRIRRWARLAVDDSGPGVEPDLREAIFERFRRADAADGTSTTGIGLGLAIARELTQLHEGSIRVEPAAEGGASFIVELPLTAPPGVLVGAEEWEAVRQRAETHAEEVRQAHRSASDVQAATVATEEDGRPRLLLVDDNPDLLQHLGEVLAPEYHVVIAGNGEQALERVHHKPPDVIVCDVRMQKMGGEEMLRRLRDTAGGADVPVLVLSANAEEEVRIRILQQAQDYAIKPIPAGELTARVRNLVITKRSRDLLQRALESREQNLETLAAEAGRRKRALEQALEEKQVLLQEVHHRVKGNLQTISSLLNLQARVIDDPVARRAIEESRNRIRMMATLHQTLYGGDSPARVELARFIRVLLQQVQEAHGVAAERIRFCLPEADMTLESPVAVPFGLIVYELVSNALRHAFPGERRGEIRIGLESEPESGGLVLTVADDGIGLPPAVDLEEPESLGLQLVLTFSEQLRGRLRVSREGGTRFTLSFPRVPSIGGRS
jgi:signal transduction histidine kinase